MNTKFTILVFMFGAFVLNAQQKTNNKGSDYKFSIIKTIEASPVPDQGKTGTCWSFSTLSFFESELARMGKGKEFNLSEMFVVRTAYPLKAENYVRMHGKAQFAEGGEAHDVVYVLKNYGMMPQEVYNGGLEAGKSFNHKEMDSVLAVQMKEVVDPKNKVIDPKVWKKNLDKTLDAYLGKLPENFEYKGKIYTPKTYAAELGLNPDDYVFITSFTHHPYYTPFVIEVPDNWAWQQAYNLPLDEMMKTLDNALQNGYGAAWAADVSEDFFKFKEGLAIYPEGWDQMNFDERTACFKKPVKQGGITPEMRQLAFDNYQTQDDHGMHITGMAKDQNGTTYYLVKNSWGTTKNDCDGYFYASDAYVKYKTISFMIHKKSLPADIAKKLGIKL